MLGVNALDIFSRTQEGYTTGRHLIILRIPVIFIAPLFVGIGRQTLRFQGRSVTIRFCCNVMVKQVCRRAAASSLFR